MAAATELGDYFTAHALDVFTVMSADPAHDAGLNVLATLVGIRPEQFTKRELFRMLLPRHRRSRPRTEPARRTRLDPPAPLASTHRTRRPAALPALRDPPPHRTSSLTEPQLADTTDRTPEAGCCLHKQPSRVMPRTSAATGTAGTRSRPASTQQSGTQMVRPSVFGPGQRQRKRRTPKRRNCWPERRRRPLTGTPSAPT